MITLNIIETKDIFFYFSMRTNLPSTFKFSILIGQALRESKETGLKNMQNYIIYNKIYTKRNIDDGKEQNANIR